MAPPLGGQLVVERSHMSAELFNLYLHQNYLDFFSSVEDVARASEYLSDADFFTGDWAVSLQNTPEPWMCGTGIVCTLYVVCAQPIPLGANGVIFYFIPPRK